MIKIYPTNDGYTFQFSGKDALLAKEKLGVSTYYMHNTTLSEAEFERCIRAIAPNAHIEFVRDNKEPVTH